MCVHTEALRIKTMEPFISGTLLCQRMKSERTEILMSNIGFAMWFQFPLTHSLSKGPGRFISSGSLVV